VVSVISEAGRQINIWVLTILYSGDATADQFTIVASGKRSSANPSPKHPARRETREEQ
jgi:hypothetical protein